MSLPLAEALQRLGRSLGRVVVVAALAMTLAAAVGPPAPPGTVDGDIVEIDGVPYQMKNGVLYTLDDPILDDPRFTVTVTDAATDAGKQRPVRTEVVDRKEIEESGALTVADVLDDQVGIQVNSSLGLGQQVTLDGLDGRHVLILIDGRPVLGRVNNRVDVSRLPVSASSIDRIEIVRGPMSALYGSEALGGVVNIITKKPSLVPQLGVDLGGQLVDVAPNLALDRAPVLWSSAGVHAKGGLEPLALRLDVTTSYLPATDRGGRSGDDDVTLEPDGKDDLPARRQMGVHAEAAVPLLDVMSLTASLDGNLAESSARTSRTAPFRDRARNNEWAATVALDGDVTPDLQVSTSLRLDRFHHVFDKLPAGSLTLDDAPAFCRSGGLFFDPACPAPPDLRTDAIVDNARIDAKVSGTFIEGVFLVHELSAAAGVVGERESALRKNGDGEDTLPGGGERLAGALFGEVLYRPIDIVTLQPGVRVDVFSPAEGDSPLGAALGPKIAARLDLPFGTSLRASYGRGFRLPSFEERFLLFDHSELGYIVNGNPALSPETNDGVRGEISWEPMAEVALSVDGYLNLLSNLITEAPDGERDGTPVFSYQNAARAYTAGLDARISVGPFFGARVDGAYQYLINAVDASLCPESNPFFCSADEGAVSLPLRPAHSLEATARYTVAPTSTTMFVRTNLLSERPVAPGETAPGYVLLAFGVRQPVLDFAELVASVDNVLDAYDPIYGPKPGRRAQVSLRVWN